MFIPRIAHREREKERERRVYSYDAFLAIDIHGDVLDSSREIKLRKERRSLEKIIFFCFPLSFVSLLSPERIQRLVVQWKRVYTKKPLKISLPNTFNAHFHFRLPFGRGSSVSLSKTKRACALGYVSVSKRISNLTVYTRRVFQSGFKGFARFLRESRKMINFTYY